MSKKVLMVVTSHSKINNEKETGIWLSEFAEAYVEFNKQGFDVTVASPLGGMAPIDPNSIDGSTPQEMIEMKEILQNTNKIEDIHFSEYDAVFLPGGHGTMYDLPNNLKLQTVIRDLYEANKIVAAVCHGPAGLVGVTLSNGQPLVAGKQVNAFTDAEEKEAGMDQMMPFLLESKLRELGAHFVTATNWNSHVEVDGNLITGQNPQSTLAVVHAVIEKLA
ncbi:type 1 glutamine amidotransferase domain-containing protein [Gottfriedia solisilvae]|uniref:type 1 glutamine amidotransferase domain-containing protein n=1 Tax=Gottfriedia solisilvae TaxID=1516104 RepID=UPI003D2F452E